MDLNDYFSLPLPRVPAEIRAALDTRKPVTLTPFDKKNDILADVRLQREFGFARFVSGDYIVSMPCPMPGVTPEMIRWWFWWHAQDPLRYRVWYPGEHFGISTDKKNSAYFSAPKLPPFQPNTHYPVERIGKLVLPLKIAFVTPEAFGFSAAAMRENDIPLIVCGSVGAAYGLVEHTEMAHIFKRTENGLMLISRFWLGCRLKSPLLRGAMLTDATARGMAEHCCVEYRRLAQILPAIYHSFGQ